MDDTPVIAFLSRNIDGMVGNSLLRGMIERAERDGVSLVCYHGGQLEDDDAAVLYTLLDKSWIDGVVSCASSKEDKGAAFYAQYRDIPFVTLTLPVEGYPVVTVDTYEGMKEVVGHFVNVHHFTKIAFVRRPDTHVYAQARFHSYLDVLRENRIPVVDELVTPPGTWSREWGEESVDIFFRQRGLQPGTDIECIVAVSDGVAIAALRSMQERGIVIPDNVALSGYNDSIEARCSNPPLTSVAMPFAEQGARAVELVLDKIQGQQVAAEVNLPARIVLGQSCGCQSPAVENAASRVASLIGYGDNGRRSDSRGRARTRGAAGAPSTAATSDGSRERIVEAMTESVLENIGAERITDKFIRRQSSDLLQAFEADIRSENRGVFLNELSEILRRIVDREVKVESWHSVISTMRSGLLSTITEKETLFRSEDLWQQARVMISETAQRVKESYYLERAKSENVLRRIGAELITTYDIEQLMDLLAEALPQVGIPGCYLSLYERDSSPRIDGSLPRDARLLLAYSEEDRIDIGKNGRVFPARELVPRDLLPQGHCFVLVAEALNFRAEQLGFVVFEAGPRAGDIYVTLKNQLSSALYGALLLQERARVKNFLEETLEKMHVKATIVSTSSQNVSANVNEISVSMEEVAASIQEISKHINQVLEIVIQAVEIAKGANSDIVDLTKNADRIGEIVKIVDDIAEQTNILALNAAIEAAHAGSAGRGFAVVAEEVKALAHKTVNSTDEINQMVNKTQTYTTETADAINKLVEIISQVSELSETINTAIVQQAEATSSISNLLIEAAGGSSEISQAISEVAQLGADSSEL
jgi:DNA-binding LacI/PurR family transcriptional regulator